MKRNRPSRQVSLMAGETETKPLSLGLVLGGGSVRGAAHIGVISVLEREGIRPNGASEPKDLLDMLLLSMNVAVRSAACHPQEADLVITPDIARASYWDFSEAQAVYEAGVQAAEEALSDLRRMLGPGTPQRH